MNDEIIDEEERERIAKKITGCHYLGSFNEVGKNFLAVVETVIGDGKDESHKQFHVYRDGTKAYQQTFDYVGPFSKDGTALVRKNGKEFFINTKGERV